MNKLNFKTMKQKKLKQLKLKDFLKNKSKLEVIITVIIQQYS